MPRDFGSLLAAALRREGIPARATALEKTRFPQPQVSESSVGTTIAVSRHTRPMEMLAAQALPGAERRLRVGADCRVQGRRLVVSTGVPESLACLPPKKFLRKGAAVPAWWFSAYEELGGGSPWHDGFDDNGTYYWTVDLLLEKGKGKKLVVLGSKDAAHPLRALIDRSGLLKQDGLTLYWSQLPVSSGPTPFVASLHFPVSPDDQREVLPGLASTLARAKRMFDADRGCRVVWKWSVLKRAIVY